MEQNKKVRPTGIPSLKLVLLYTTVLVAGCLSGQPSENVLHLSKIGAQIYTAEGCEISKNGSLIFSSKTPEATKVFDKEVFAVSFNTNSDVSVESISVLPKLKNLKVLSFSDLQLPQGFAEIVANCNSLEFLNVAGSNFGDRDLQYLQSLPSLKTIDLFQSQVSATGISSCKQKRPSLNILNWYH